MKIIYLLIVSLSYLPFVFLYRLSDVTYYVVYYLVRYRRKVVRENLVNSFPTMNGSEIINLEKKFYRHFCDIIFESIKGFSISDREIQKRHKYLNIDLLELHYSKGHQVSILGAHYCNWEWVALSLPRVTQFKTYGVYLPLTNLFLNRVIKESRQRSGMNLISSKEISTILKDPKKEVITMGFIGDQSPSRDSKRQWLKFLNQDTASIKGYEYFAKEYNTPVLYLNITKPKRGHYECTFYTITDEPKLAKEGQIVETYMAMLEKFILMKPEYWLWSHRRWKIKK